MAIKLITAGAGSGKTYQICEEIIGHFRANPDWQPAQLIVTTFTNAAASELRERITSRLMEEGDFQRVSALSEACIGTVHSICLRFLQKYGYLINLSPELNTLPDGEDLTMVNELLEGRNLESLHAMELRLSQVDSQTKANAYPGTIKNIIELVRINGLRPDELSRSAEMSVQTYFDILGSETLELDETVFIRLLQEQFDYFDPIKEKLKSKNKVFFEVVNELLTTYLKGEQQLIPWNQYLKLLVELNKEYQMQVIDFQEYVARHIHWPNFRKDIEGYTKELFETSAEILNQYQKRKSELGVIDYADMELMMLVLLKNPDFAKEFEAQFRLILVDEFQDTSPLQLRIFKAWSELAGKSIWVGDIKQSIYGFRGADASLVQAVIDELPEEDKIPLITSFRSRKALVEAANTLFIKAFYPIQESYIRLLPRIDAQDDNGMKAPLIELNLEKKNFQENLALCIGRVLKEKWIIFDKESRIYRPAEPSDICILFRNEGQSEEITNMGRALMKEGIPLAKKGALFTTQPEVYFLFAILRYLVNRRDDFAISQILYFSAEQPSAKGLIEERARFLIENSERELKSNYGEDNQFIRQLEYLIDLKGRFTISQLLEMVFQRTDLQHIAQCWGRSESSKETMNRLIGLATGYSNACAQQKTIEGIYGYIQYVNDNAHAKSRDELSGSGINVMTYHSAKGLEWPLVFMASMDNQAKGTPFKPMVSESLSEDVNLQDRWIRYWPWPYAKGVTTSELNTKFSDEKDNLLKKSREEEKRLFYVGFTRARDYLILVNSENNFDWIKMSCGEQWREGLNIKTFEFEESAEPIVSDRQIKNVIKRIPNPLLSSDPYFLAPSQDSMEVISILKEPVRLGNYIALLANTKTEEEAILGNLFHQFFAVRRHPGSLIESYGLSHLLKQEHLEESIKRLQQWVGKVYPDAIWHCEWPMTYYFKGQLIQGFADLVLELPDFLILIDHKSYPGGGDSLHKHIKEKNYPGQLAWYKKALDASSDKKVKGVYLHFPVSSAMVEVEFED